MIKNYLFILMILFSYIYCPAQKYLKVSANYNNTTSFVNGFRVFIINNKYHSDSTYFTNDYPYIKTFWDDDLLNIKKIEITIDYSWGKMIVCDLLKNMKNLAPKDTLKYFLNVDSINLLMADELYNKLLKEYDKKLKILKRYVNVLRIATNLSDDYERKISGKKKSNIYDMLYYEGFHKTYDNTDNIFKEVFSTTYNYDNEMGDKDKITLYICFWYSYGYGDLIFNITYNISLSNFGTVMIFREETEDMKNLINRLEDLKNILF